MRKLHKKYIVLNVFLIIYIMSLSVGYAYFSESIQVTGTAKTLEYSRMPLAVYVNAEVGNFNLTGHDFYLEEFLTYNGMKHPAYDIYEYYYTFDYTAYAADNDNDFSFNTSQSYVFIKYEKTVDIPISNFAVVIEDLTNCIEEFSTRQNTKYSYSDYDAPKTSNGYYSYGGGQSVLYYYFYPDLGGMEPNIKKILVTASFTSQEVDRNLKIYFIINMI